LQSDLLQRTVREENLLKIRLGDAEVDVSNIETMERSAIASSCWSTFAGGAGSTVLLCFSELGNNRNSLQLLASQLNGFWD
jgi:hypothetical protein